MNKHVYIQAREGSSRFPKKILKKIDGKTILELIVERAQKIEKATQVIIVTGNAEKNQTIINLAKKMKIPYWYGSEENILDRFYHASKKFGSDIIIRITGDCPIIDFEIIDNGLCIYDEKKVDGLTNTKKRTFPHGLDFEIFSKSSLEKIWKQNKQKFSNEEEFLNTFMNPVKDIFGDKQFKIYNLENELDLSHIRLTVDYPEDFLVIEKIYEKIYPKKKNFTIKDVLEFLNQNKEILELNKNRSMY